MQEEGYVEVNDFFDMEEDDIEDFPFLKKPEKKRLKRLIESKSTTD